MPTDKVTETVPPLPKSPSIEEFQLIELVRSPSSASEAMPLKEIDVPSSTAVPSVGAVMLTLGTVLNSPVVKVHTGPAVVPEELTSSIRQVYCVSKSRVPGLKLVPV